MISKKDNPVAWATFMYELEDAKEHLERLIEDLEGDSEYDGVFLKKWLIYQFCGTFTPIV